MKAIKKPRELFVSLKKLKCGGSSIGFVPTMGALHEGHLSLIRAARRENDTAVVSIFVNPAQFGRGEDLKKYPRPLKKDLLLCRKEKVDFVFLPRPLDMYPQGFSTYVNVEGLSEVLCARSRPGHFKGVATVVTKLFNIVQPDTAYFGQKDAQQAAIIKRMAEDLNMPVKIKVMPIIREASGLAMSSRNAYLNKEERCKAIGLYRALKLARLLIRSGARDSSRIVSRMRRLIEKDKGAKIDYIAVVGAQDLKPLKKVSGDYLIALAVKFGKTRLIDNLEGHV